MSEEMNNGMNNQNETPNSSVNAGSTGNNYANAQQSQNAEYANGGAQNNYSNGGAENSGYTNNQNNGYGNQNSGYTNNQNSYGNYQYSNPYSNAYGSNPTPNGNNNRGKKEKKKGNAGKIALVACLAAVIGVGAGAGTYLITDKLDNSEVESKLEASLNLAGAEGEDEIAAEKSSGSGEAATLQTAGSSDAAITATVTDVSDIVSATMPSIVSVYNTYTATANYWGQMYSQEAEATGSGIIISKTDDELLIATNNHVVEDADELSVLFINDKEATANVKGTDPSNDLAVIAVKLSDLDSDTLSSIKVATLGDSDNLSVGDAAIAIGNALGYGQSVTTGVISALDREITDANNKTNTFIQTDAAINPGNSGGALLNDRGQVIGINSSKIGATTVEGIGYAIPISRAIPIFENLMNQETKTKLSEDEQGYLGIQGVSVTQQIASAYGMPEGVYVASVIEGSGAASSDLQEGDIITGINGVTVESMDDLKTQLEYYSTGTEITLTVQRASDGNSYEETEVKVTLGDKNTLKNTSSDGSEAGQSSENGDEQKNGSTQDGFIHSFGFEPKDNEE